MAKTTSSRSPARRPPARPDMSAMLKKVLGIVLLLSTTGLASCQAMWTKALVVPFSFGFWN